ncbi:MAG TPA: Rrf2 family transcriptional regulator [Candidatus Polarisedimenticolia bacterium]|nr:Rrf2 family transcriptional regulator [Candidatus Polarisedimenticolia bacterium]
MVLTQTGEYALRAVLFIAGPGAGRTVRGEEIAAQLGIPPSYLAKTLQILVREGVLASTRGRSGGFRLAIPAGRLTLMQVVAPFDETGKRHCLLGRTTCSDKTACAVHHAWKATAERITEFFRVTTVASLKSPVEQIAPLA